MAENEVELHEAVQTHNARRSKLGKKDLSMDFYQSPNPQRMFVGDIAEISANDVERNDKGQITKDTRVAIEPNTIAQK